MEWKKFGLLQFRYRQFSLSKKEFLKKGCVQNNGWKTLWKKDNLEDSELDDVISVRWLEIRHVLSTETPGNWTEYSESCLKLAWTSTLRCGKRAASYKGIVSYWGNAQCNVCQVHLIRLLHESDSSVLISFCHAARRCGAATLLLNSRRQVVLYYKTCSKRRTPSWHLVTHTLHTFKTPSPVWNLLRYHESYLTHSSTIYRQKTFLNIRLCKPFNVHTCLCAHHEGI